MVKICPKCKSTQVEPMLGGIMGTWKCGKCGFTGAIFPDIEETKEDEDDEIN